MIIAAHGNSLRALVKYLDNISDADIVERNIPTGIPLVYELDDDLKPIRSYYLGDPARGGGRGGKSCGADTTEELNGKPPTFPFSQFTSSVVSSAAILNDLRNRRSLAVTSNVRRGC